MRRLHEETNPAAFWLPTFKEWEKVWALSADWQTESMRFFTGAMEETAQGWWHAPSEETMEPSRGSWNGAD